MLKSFYRRPRSNRRSNRFGVHAARLQAASQMLEDRRMLTFDIQFDYSMDDAGFFSPNFKRDQLERAAEVIEARITDTLDAITPGGVNSWTARPIDPETGTTVNLSNLNIPADTVIVYVGVRNIGGSLGLGGPGAWSASGTSAWLDTVNGRGEAGIDRSDPASDTDVAPWGGTLTFNSTSNWHFGNDEPSVGEHDFYSVALHELGHLLGIGTADSWDNLINGSNEFTGTASVAEYGGNVPLYTDSSHFDEDVEGFLPGTSITQEAEFDPNITVGTRKELTALDWAALDDIGWDVTAVVATDYGDAPDTAAGTASGNYNTLATDNGPSHAITSALFLGATVDGDLGTQQDATATADDLSTDDEDGISDPVTELTVTIGTAPSVSLTVTNTSGTLATLTGWIDFNNDGIFSNTTERAQVSISNGTISEIVQLDFPTVPDGYAGGTFARFRLSTDAAASDPTGAAADGEVEDYAATIVAPETTDTLPTFEWAAVTDATKYELVVDNLSLPQSDVILQSNLLATRFTAHEALPVGEYSWKVRAFVDDAWQDFGDSQFFSIVTVATQTELTDPVTDDVDSSPTFAWNAVQNATRYELWVNDQTNGISRVVHRTDLNSTSYKPYQALPPATYRAWVRAFNGNTAIGTWSSAVDYTISDSAATPQITDPVGSSDISLPLFSWTPTTNTNYYELWVNDVTNSVSQIVFSRYVNQPYYQTPEALEPGTYTAWVRANVAGSGWTSYSDPVDFEVLAVSGQTTVTAPYGSGNSTLPTFAWTPVSTATHYELWVNDQTNGISRVIHQTEVDSTSFTPRSALAAGTYRTWVRAFNGSSAIGTWSPAVDYTVVESSLGAQVLTPNNTSTNTLPRFSWVAEPDTSRYELWVNDVTNGVSRVIHETSLTTTAFISTSALTDAQYRVWVRSFDLSDSPRAWSAPVDFEVELAATTTLVSPLANEIIAAADVIFAWTQTAEATGAYRYELWVNDDTRSIARVIHETALTTNAFVPASQLQAGEYRAWIRLFDSAGTALAWSSVVAFTVVQNDQPVPEADGNLILTVLPADTSCLEPHRQQPAATSADRPQQPPLPPTDTAEARHADTAVSASARRPLAPELPNQVVPTAQITPETQMWTDLTDLLMTDFASLTD